MRGPGPRPTRKAFFSLRDFLGHDWQGPSFSCLGAKLEVTHVKVKFLALNVTYGS